MFIDIKNESPKKDDSYFVDTNVWFWFTYASSKSFLAHEPHEYQKTFYPNFIESALNKGAQLFYSPLTLVELSNLIERSEWNIHKLLQQNDCIPLKTFRKAEEHRKSVLEEINTAWATIKTMAKPLPLTVDESLPDSFIDIISKYKIDGYDALFFYAMTENGIQNIITDDKDFRNIDKELLNVYTCYK